MLSERMQGVDVGGDSVIREVSRHNPPQPLTLLCNRVMPPAPQLITDVPQRCAHAITLAIPAQQESAIASLCAYVRESEKVEGLRPSLAPPGSTLGSVFAKLDQTGFLRVEGQRKLRQPGLHVRAKAFGVIDVLETDNESSSGRESHPSALTEPDVKLAPHPAPTLQPPVARRAATGRTDWGPVARCFPANASMLVPVA